MKKGVELGSPASADRRALWGAAAVVLAVVLVGIGAGCGRKIPPVPPPQYRPAAPANVQYSLDGNNLHLFWQVPEPAEPGTGLEGCRVYRAARNIGENACPACPASFAAAAELPLESADQKSQSFRETLQPGFLYAYKVACYTDRGNVGKQSQPVYVQFDE